jgi:hypothetical protein
MPVGEFKEILLNVFDGDVDAWWKLIHRVHLEKNK